MSLQLTVPISKTCLPCDGEGSILFPIAMGVISLIPCNDCGGTGQRKRTPGKPEDDY